MVRQRSQSKYRQQNAKVRPVLHKEDINSRYILQNSHHLAFLISIHKSPKSLKPDPSTTIADLTAQRAALLGSFASIPSISSLLQAQNEPTASTLTDTNSGASASVISSSPPDTAILGAAKNIIAQHIKLLHTYNEIKDIGQGLMGLIADARGVRIVEVQEEFGIGVKD